ncbi:hypothetical protein H4R19_000306 [Coemansia spiralis]|nr:hypothetical protein H4R19_000306 [Coemansia spiralis]
MTAADNEPKSDTRGAADGNAGASGKQQPQPTWDEVVRTQSPMGTGADGNDLFSKILCFEASDRTSTSDFVSELREPLSGRMMCFEMMSRSMAKLAHEQRRAASNGGMGWSEVWYGRWTQRLQVVRVLGSSHIKTYMSMPGPTQLNVPRLFSDEEQRRIIKIIPMDRALVTAWHTFGQHLVTITQPGIRMTRKYIESWQSGERQERLAQIGNNMLDLGAARIIGRMVAFFGRIKNIDKDNQD